MIPFAELYITNGTTTCNLMDNISYGVDAFEPVVAPRQRSELAAGGPYLPVVQPLTVNVFGDTPGACYDNLATLIRLLDQGESWARDIPVSASRIVIKAIGGLQPVGAEILGQVGDDEALASIAPEYEVVNSFARWVIRNVSLSFLRGGVWEFSVDATDSSSTVSNPGVLSVTFANGSNRNYCRYRVQWGKGGILNDGGLREDNYAYALFASSSSKLLVLDSVSFTTPAGTSNVADAGADAFGGSVKRIQASTTENSINVTSAWTTPQRRVGMFVAVRNNSATATWYIRGEVTDYDNTPNRTAPVTVDTSSALPQILFLGTLSGRFDQTVASVFRVYVTASITDAAQTLDIDYVALICLDDPWTDRVMVFGNGISATGALANPLIVAGDSILRTPYPVVTTSVAGVPHAATQYVGDPYLVCTGTSMALLVLTTNGDTFWRLRDGGGAIAMGMSVRRTQAFRTPLGANVP